MGFVPGQYFTDGSVPVVVKVRDEHFADTDFGWTAPAAGSFYQGYGSLKPRRVGGVDPATGRFRSQVVPDIGANVWTGAATTFTQEDQNGNATTYTITSRRGELLHLSR